MDKGQGLSELRTGMSCKTDVIVAAYNDVLTVPLQAVTIVDGQHVVYVPTPDGPKPAPVEVGLDNGRRAHLVSGLNEGQEVVMRPPLQPSAKKSEDGLDEEMADEADRAAREATQKQQQGNGAGTAEQGSAPGEGADRMKRMLTRLTPERIDALELDEGTKAALKQAVSDAKAGKEVALDPATMAKLRAAFGSPSGGQRTGGQGAGGE